MSSRLFGVRAMHGKHAVIFNCGDIGPCEYVQLLWLTRCLGNDRGRHGSGWTQNAKQSRSGVAIPKQRLGSSRFVSVVDRRAKHELLQGGTLLGCRLRRHVEECWIRFVSSRQCYYGDAGG